jgi:hypothetical protein
MWYIWKARNDNRFQRKTWTPFSGTQGCNSSSTNSFVGLE